MSEMEKITETAAAADKPEITPEEARRRYKREWAAAHREQVREAQRRYWQRKADEYNAAMAQATAQGDDAGHDDTGSTDAEQS